eukprot:TRINITY_DN1537_c0_g1_i3.p1 TRINITY_DN1537_c0_g1~~TRINITY_DN1537_c0_g1_i3.p1  ORF type:complete len:437 (-),score=118.01 TRINITY_DN1537_c0_g1_i3:1100-2410(-)
MDLAESEGWAIISAHLSTAHENPTLLLAFALPVVFLLIGLTAKAHGRLRPTSFTSGVMFAGSNPDAWGSPEPIIHACLYYDKCPTREGLEAAAKLMMDFGNYRGTVVQTGSWPRRTWGWKEISVHVPDTISFIKVHGAKAAHEAVERLMIEDLPKVDSCGDPLPLWHINVIENTATGGESVVLVRNHHVIGDGVSLIGVIDHVMFTPEGEPLDVSGALQELKGGSGARPKKPSVFSLMGKALSGLVQVALVGVSPFDSKVSLNGPSEEKLKFGPRCFVHFPNVPLDLVKKLKDAAGVTVNDIMMCVTSGALRRHLTSRGTTPPGPLKLRALLPIAMPRKITREQRFDEGLENVWGFASADMCVGVSDIKEVRMYMCAFAYLGSQVEVHCLTRERRWQNVWGFASADMCVGVSDIKEVCMYMCVYTWYFKGRKVMGL